MSTAAFTPERRWFPIVLRELHVLRAHEVTPRMRRVVLGGPELGAFRRYGYDLTPFHTEAPDDHVKLFFPAPGGGEPVLPQQDDGHLHWPHEGPRPLARDYTPRRFDPDLGELELDFVLHPGGVAAQWATRAAPGDRIFLAGPKTSTVLPRQPRWYLLAGDETALPAIARRLAELPAGSRAAVFVEVDGPQEEQKLDTDADVDITWLHRGEAGGAGLLERAIRRMHWVGDDVYVWVAGEAGMVRAVREQVRTERGVPRERISATGYWKRGSSLAQLTSRMPELLGMIDLLTPHALRAAVTLELPELVASGVQEVAELARRSGTSERALRPVLAHLAVRGVLRPEGFDRYALTDLGELLLAEEVRERLDLGLAQAPRDLAYAGLLHTLRTGEAGYARASGGSGYRTDLASNPAAAEQFAVERGDEEQRWLPALLAARDWPAGQHVVDVGGGSGAFVTRLLQEHPAVRATVLDLPGATRPAADRAATGGVGDRLTVVEQRLTDPWPSGGDVHLLAHVLLDQPDEQCLAMLCRAAEVGGRVLVLEELRAGDAAGWDDEYELESHLEKLVTYGGGMRTESEIAALASSAGLRHVATRPLGAHRSLLEFLPTG